MVFGRGNVLIKRSLLLCTPLVFCNSVRVPEIQRESTQTIDAHQALMCFAARKASGESLLRTAAFAKRYYYVRSENGGTIFEDSSTPNNAFGVVMVMGVGVAVVVVGVAVTVGDHEPRRGLGKRGRTECTTMRVWRSQAPQALPGEYIGSKRPVRPGLSRPNPVPMSRSSFQVNLSGGEAAALALLRCPLVGWSPTPDEVMKVLAILRFIDGCRSHYRHSVEAATDTTTTTL